MSVNLLSCQYISARQAFKPFRYSTLSPMSHPTILFQNHRSLAYLCYSTQGLWYLRIRTRRESCLIYWKFQIRYFLWSSIFVPYTKLRNLGDDQHVVVFYTNCNIIVFVCIMWCEHVGTVTLKVKLVEKSCNALKKYIWFLCNFCGFFSIRPQRFLT